MNKATILLPPPGKKLFTPVDKRTLVRKKIISSLLLYCVLLCFGGSSFAQIPQVLKDISGVATLSSQSNSGYNFKGLNGHVYFSADDGLNGFELWKTNGTEAGTVMVKDINPGLNSSSPQTFIEMNGVLYFMAITAASGSELWRTDGTEQGTVLVKEIGTGSTGSGPSNFIVLNGQLFFSAQTSTNGRELWKSDGTEAGTVLVKDINTGSVSSTPGNFVVVNGVLYFTATTAANGVELWKSDGSTAGTVLVKDINTGSASTSFFNLTAFGNYLLFSAQDPANGFETWRSDGTEAGTFIVKNLNPGTGTGSSGPYYVMGSQVCFLGDDGTTGIEWYVTDGTEAGTFLLKDIFPGSNSSSPQNMTVVNNIIYFTATDNINGTELWKTDGTVSGTTLIKDINTGSLSSSPSLLTNVNGLLYFRATSATFGAELWKSDGTDAGTVMVKDITAGVGGTSISNLTVLNNVIYFTAPESGQLVLFKSDGTVGGTVSLNTAIVSGGTFATLFGYESRLYFLYNGLKAGIPSTATGNEPWTSDGTDAGTKLLKDINSRTAASSPANFCKVGSTVFFTADDAINGSELWKTDGTESGTVMVKDIRTGSASSSPSNLININGTLFFSATTSAGGNELWKSDGTEAGTIQVKDINTGTSGSIPTLLTDVNGVLFFVANTALQGSALWKSDGTEAGTVMVADIIAGATPSPNFAKLTNVNGTLFFLATLSASGTELWKSNGTAAGTVMVKDIIAGSGSPGIDDLIAYNGKLFFSASDGINGNEPWVSDGTEAGTTLFVNISTSGSFPNSNPTNFAVANGKLFFSAFTANTQFEPWMSDGTPGGTFMITEITPGSSGSTPFGFTAMNGIVYFNALSPGIGRELWRTDGTAIGTQLVKDINTGTGDGAPTSFTVVNNTIFFTATTPSGGVELYKSDGTTAGTIGFDLYPGTVASNPASLTALNDMLLFSANHPIMGIEVWKATALPAPSSSFFISGDTTPCVGSTVEYKALNVVGDNVSYNWSLPNGGGTLSTHDSIATVTWTTTGAKQVSLSLSNSNGSTPIKYQNINVITGGTPPTQAPVISRFARMLTASNFPNGAKIQWYRNGEAITGATQPDFYAQLDGTYSARFIIICAAGPQSNEITFGSAAIPQTITFEEIADIELTPAAYIKLVATSSSGLPVFYQKVLGPGFIQNDTLFITGNGTLTGDVVIKAMQPGNEEFSPAPDVQQTIRVLKGNQVITFDSIPDMILGPQLFPLTGSSSVGLPVSYSIIAGNGLVSIVSGNKLKLTGAGTVTIRASQIGNANYFGASPVERTFCIGIRSLQAINGDASPCINTYRYTIQKIPGANYEWTLSGGGTLTTHLDTAWITWNTPGNHTLKVKANSMCDQVFSEESVLEITTANNPPSPVNGMFPANGVIDQQLPLRLSWIPGSGTTSYDLYIWNALSPQPATPFVSNIEDIFFTLPAGSLAFNATYKWRVVSKNPCQQTAGPIQEFSIIPLPDLVVSDVQAPSSATSGQTITVSWKVTNTGPGRTLPGATWYDGVYFALDTVPNVSFNGSPNWNPSSWSSLTANGRPLLLGKKIRPTSLESGQSYTNSINFTLPLSYSFPVYIYVITDNEHPNWKILQVSVANDTSRKATPMNIELAPAPDLRVDSVFTTGSTFSGSTVNLTYKVKNYGVLTPAGSTWIDSVFISQSPLFDRTNSIALKMPKANGSYYPRASDAGYYNHTQLQTDSFYTRSTSVVIPNFIFGTWFIYVKTNANETGSSVLYEGASVENNLGRAQLQVYLAPTPKLTINSLNIPLNSASTSQLFGASWKIKNEGFRDNIEKNKGHYITMGTCITTCPPGTMENTVCRISSVVKDSVTFGSSYWVDRVFLSRDPGGLNLSNAILVKEVPHGTPYSGINVDPDPNYISCAPRVFGNTNVDNIINPGSEFPKTINFNIPSDLLPGQYYVYVYTNATKSVFEYPGTPQIIRSELPVNIQRPDVTVESISVPPNTTGGTPVTVSYNLKNNGPGTVFNHIRHDQLYISNSSVFDANAMLIATNTITEDLPLGASVPHSFSYNMPHATSGIKYFYVITNYDSAFRETNYANNRSSYAITNVSAAVPADLVVTNVQANDSVFTVFSDRIIYTVANNGSGAASGTWTDSLFISCSPTFNTTTSYFIGKKTRTNTVTPSSTYTDTLILNLKYGFQISSCFAEAMYSQAYFFVKTNADNIAYEGTATVNNRMGSGIRILVNPLVDHIVTTASAPDVTSVGSAYPVRWKIKNIGYNPIALQYYSSWYEAIFFSTDSIPDDGDIKAAEHLKYITLKKDQDSSFSKSLVVPYMPSGDYYVYVHNNHKNSIAGEKVIINNTNFIRNEFGAAKKVQVTLPPMSDLVDSIISAPAVVDAGQPITVIYRIRNAGTGVTFPGTNFQNRLLLSSDFATSVNDGDRLLATRNRTSVLQAGQFYYDTVTVTIPASTPAGNYVLISQANAANSVIETNVTNNLGFSLISIQAAPLSDLIVSHVRKPDTVLLGYTIDTAKWVIKNVSGEQARGLWRDAVYLSAGNFVDSSAVLLGTKIKEMVLQPLQEDTVRMAPLVLGVVEGDYNMFVKTDFLGNIAETDEENNTGSSVTPVYVKAKELKLNVAEQNNLKDISRYYKLVIPDSLYGSTILVTLKTGDSLLLKNEMFIGGGYVPTAAHYDYRYETPNFGNQQIVITDASDPVYYIMYRCASPYPPTQTITLKAVKLPFSILNVHTNSGGNNGNVTVRIRGSLFTNGMVAKLSNGTNTIYATAVYYSNSTQVYATFPLQGKPLGTYDVTLTKPDETTAIFSNGFTIVPPNNGGLITGGGINTGAGNGNDSGCEPGAESGLNSQLVVELVVPSRVLTNRPVVLLVNFSNPTNFDIPIQSRIIYSEEDVRMAFTKEGVTNGSTSLYLEFSEPGGPPGIIRPGGSGTITIHARSPRTVPSDGSVLFKLK